MIKFIEMQRVSKLSISDPKYKPLYCHEEYNKYNRKLNKLLANTGWYSDLELVVKTKWRDRVPLSWSGDKPSQFQLPGMDYTTIMQVPSSKDSRLFKMLAKS